MVSYRRELRMKVNIKKKGKNGEGNRVFRKNKESIEEIKDSIKKSTEGDKITSRQGKERIRGMEERRQGNVKYKEFGI